MCSRASKTVLDDLKRILTSCKLLFAHACGKRLIDSNPAAGIDLVALMGERPDSQARDAERRGVTDLLADIDDIGGGERLGVPHSARHLRDPSNWKARREHIDFDRAAWWVPEDSVKTGRVSWFPFTPTVVNWFKDLRDLAGESSWVLPAN